MSIFRVGKWLGSFFSMRAPPRNPLIAIIGATGTGKSQLAVEIAKRYNGEVINGDAMQLYAGLPIITNKITVEEQQGIPHHLLGCIGLHEQTWVVSTFVKSALKVVEEIRSRGRLPILVGGTHYYTQSLLFKDRLAEHVDSKEQSKFVQDLSEQWPVLKESNEVLLEELRKVDPIMADRWHPNDRRKIQRSLEIYLQTGKRASEIYADQRIDVAAQGAELRFPTLLFWVHAEQGTLRDRLDKRVDKMLDQGLLNEVETLNGFAKKETTEHVDESKGIWVSIGYKEFKEYVQSGEDDNVKREKLKAEAVERTKIATRQYAKHQVKWIRIKLTNALADADAAENLYLLDGTDIARYNQDVVEPALGLTRRFLAAEGLPSPTSLSTIAAEQLKPKREDFAGKPEDWVKQHCEVCGVTAVTPLQWEQHMSSKSHKKRASKQRQAEKASAPLD